MKKIVIRTVNHDLSGEQQLINAYDISFNRKTNRIWNASFKLPLDDEKIKYVTPFKWVEILRDGKQLGLYRIMPKRTVQNTQNNEVKYELEHVLATLLDNSIFKYAQIEGKTTTVVLNWLLDMQKDKHWRLGTVDFKRYFSYSWENENLLSCLFSIPKPFDEQYRWEWNTTIYPFTLNLVKPSENVVARIKEGHNLVGFEINDNPNGLFNRIYPLGAGEGVNQLDIKKINNGKPYVEDAASIKKYGLHEYIWADKRFTVKENLKSSAEAMLKKWKEPQVSWQTNAIDVSEITGVSYDSFREGDLVLIETEKYGDVKIRILEEKRSDILGSWHSAELKIGSPIEDLSTTASDIARRQQINELYSQGQTTILQDSIRDNCDPEHPAVFEFDIDNDVVNVNTVELTFDTKPFRANSRATEGGGARVGTTESGGSTSVTSESGGATKQTSSSGGSSTQTSTSGGSTTQSSTAGGGGTVTSEGGGGTTESSSSGGGGTKSSSGGGDHHHILFNKGHNPGTIPHGELAYSDGFGSTFILKVAGQGYTEVRTAEASGSHSHSVTFPSHTHSTTIPAHKHDVKVKDHTHKVTIPSHTHDINIPNHTHSVEIPSHTHRVDIPSHKHEIILPDHKHKIDYGIFEESSPASKVEVYANDKLVGEITGNSANRVNIVKYLAKSEDGTIIRGRHTIKLKPNKRARIEAKVICRVFIQSQLGGEF